MFVTCVRYQYVDIVRPRGCSVSQSSENTGDNVANNRWNDEYREHDADCAAADNAAPAVDLSAHCGSNKLLEHRAWVE